MKQEAAVDAVRSLLGVYSQEHPRWARIDKAVAPITDLEIPGFYGVSRDSKNFDRQMRIARQSFNPVLSLMLSTYGQSLKVDNYFKQDQGGGREEATPWQWWQRNRMDGRQTGLHHAACKYGLAYTSVLPADFQPSASLVAPQRGAVINTFNPKRMTTVYGESWDWGEYPILALQHVDNGFRLYDEEYVYYFGVERKPRTPQEWSQSYYVNHDNLRYLERRKHGIGVTPVVRYLDRMMTDGEESVGMVEPLIGLADRIHMTNYQEGVARHWAAFKQRYIIGWAPKSEAEAFAQKASDTWWFKDTKQNVQVGQFDETDLGQYVGSRQSTEQAFAALAQLPATVMGASAISNVSAEGLAALERSKDSQTSELQTSLGESHEQTFRLCAYVAGDLAGAEDFGAEVKWKDTSAKSIAQTVDALGKMASMLGIPDEELWSEIPGWTHQQVERAKRARDKQLKDFMKFDPMDAAQGLVDSPEPKLGGDLAKAAGKKPPQGGKGNYGSAGGGGRKGRGVKFKLKDGDGDGIYGES